MKRIAAFSALLVVFCFVNSTALAWDYEGHRIVNQLALASLPSDFPAFARTPEARERIAFLAGEADRWRNSPDLPLKHCNGPDHFIDIEDIAPHGLDATALSPFRYEFTAQLAAARALHPDRFESIDPAKNEDKTKALVGFLPWTISEYYSKLKSGFSYLKTFEQEGGTPEEISNAQQNILYVMGVMGHFLGDAGQPLHTTKHYNGWVGDNPKRYATNKTFHSWVDGGYIRKIGLNLNELLPSVRPARNLSLSRSGNMENVFPVIMDFILDQHKLVEPLYILNKEGSLSDTGEPGSKGRKFMGDQMLKSGQFLGDLWLSAWLSAPPDTYLKSQLAKRKLQPAATAEAAK